MTVKQLYSSLKTLRIPVAYGVFKERQELPFMVYELYGDNSTYADNIHYVRVREGFIELYTPFRDFMLERRLEKLLERRKVSYRLAASRYITEEEMQCTRWDIEFVE